MLEIPLHACFMLPSSRGYNSPAHITFSQQVQRQKQKRWCELGFPCASGIFIEEPGFESSLAMNHTQQFLPGRGCRISTRMFFLGRFPIMSQTKLTRISEKRQKSTIVSDKRITWKKWAIVYSFQILKAYILTPKSTLSGKKKVCRPGKKYLNHIECSLEHPKNAHDGCFAPKHLFIFRRKKMVFSFCWYRHLQRSKGKHVCCPLDGPQHVLHAEGPLRMQAQSCAWQAYRLSVSSQHGDYQKCFFNLLETDV